MKEDIAKQLINNEVTLKKELFPKLRHHYKYLRRNGANKCILKIVELLPRWMVVKAAEELKHVTKKKTKVIEWVERTPADYLLEEMASLRETIREKVQSQYTKSVRKATHILHLRDISLVPGSGVYEFTASQLMPGRLSLLF